MIAFLQGTVLACESDSVIINVRGVGYEAQVSSFTAAALTAGQVAELWIHTHVREDALQLFGFLSNSEKNMFLSLIRINGVGPKVAMKILSGAPLATLVQMIEESDVAALAKLPKVGKKTAEQIVLGLKGKLTIASDSKEGRGFSSRSDIVSALVNLGFKIQDVERVVNQMEPATDFSEGVKRGLSALAGTF